MSRLQQFLVGGIGGLLTVLVTLVSLDVATFAEYINEDKVTVGLCCGWGARIVGLFLLGGGLAWASREVTNPMTLLQIGIAAPALVMSYATGAEVAQMKKAAATQPVAQIASLVSYAMAGESEIYPRNQQREILVAGAWDDFVKGLTPGFGTKVKRKVEDLRRPNVITPGMRLYVFNPIDGECLNIENATFFTPESLDITFPAEIYKVRKGTCETRRD